MNIKKIVFVTGTRADFGKIKPLINNLEKNENFDVLIFSTGMHQLKKYDYTYKEIEKSGFKNIFNFINQNENDTMDHVLAKTISGFSDYLFEVEPDMVVVHGDRIESLAAAAVGCLNNIFVSHIEGGEVSGTVDEMIRHSITKLSHFHFVSNKQSKSRLIQMGEMSDRIFEIGSPETDIIKSSDLPSINQVKKYYNINFDNYAVVIFHPVTTEYKDIDKQVDSLLDVIINDDNRSYVVIHPNNDHGSKKILIAYKRFENIDRFRVLTSMRFEYFLVLLKESEFLIGNSSCGVRETPLLGVPSINIGTRQYKRNTSSTIINSNYSKSSLKNSIRSVKSIQRKSLPVFGKGNCADKFEKILSNKKIWSISTQKYFIDI